MWQPSRRDSGKPKSTSTQVRDALADSESMDEGLFRTFGNRSISNVINVSEFANGDASGSKTPPRTILLDSSPSADNVKRHVITHPMAHKLDASVGDAWQSPPAARSQAPATQARHSRKPRHENDSTPNADDELSLYRSHIDAECSRKQLQAAILERDHLEERLVTMQKRSMHEAEIREKLKVEFRTGLAPIQQQLSEMGPAILNEIRSTLQSEISRLKSVVCEATFVNFCGVFEAMEQRLAKEIRGVKDVAGNSNVVVQQLACLNTNMNKYAETIHESLGTRVEADFSVVLNAIEDLETRLDLSRLQQLLHAHKVDMDRHVSSTEQLIRDGMAVHSDRETKSKSELEGSLLQAIRDIVPPQEHLSQIYDALRENKVSMRGLHESVRGLDQLHETAQRKHAETSRKHEEVSRLVNKMNDTLEHHHEIIQKPHAHSTDMISRWFEETQKQLSNVLSEVTDLQTRMRQRDVITQTRQEESIQKLSLLQDTLQQQQRRGFDLDELQQSMRAQSEMLYAVQAKQNEIFGVVKQHGDQHRDALSQMHVSIQERQKQPSSNEEMNGLLKQLHSTVTRIHDSDSLKLRSDFENLHQSMREQSDNLLKACRALQNNVDNANSRWPQTLDAIQATQNEMFGVVKQHGDQHRDALSQIQVKLREQQKEPSSNAEMNGLLKQLHSTVTQLHDSKTFTERSAFENMNDKQRRKVSVDLSDPNPVDDPDGRRTSTGSMY